MGSGLVSHYCAVATLFNCIWLQMLTYPNPTIEGCWQPLIMNWSPSEGTSPFFRFFISFFWGEVASFFFYFFHLFYSGCFTEGVHVETILGPSEWEHMKHAVVHNCTRAAIAYLRSRATCRIAGVYQCIVESAVGRKDLPSGRASKRKIPFSSSPSLVGFFALWGSHKYRSGELETRVTCNW